MRYVSTRGQAPALSFEEVVLTGMASDGGLYVPESVPTFSREELASMAGLSYAEIAFRVMKPFVNGEIDDETFHGLVTDAYATFNHDAVLPLKQLDANHFLLEQFHGTVSLPFEAGENRRIAVKIVDDRGIESLKIMSLEG